MLESITVITLLLSALDRIDLQAVFDRDGYESRRRALPGARLVKVLVVYQMIGTEKLRGLIRTITEHTGLQAALGGRVALNTLSNGVRERDVGQMVEAWMRVLQTYGPWLKGMGRKFARIAVVDASLIKLSLLAYSWAEYRKRRGAAKMHAVLEWARGIPQQLVVTTGKVHDLKGAARLHWARHWTYIFDRAYLGFGFLSTLLDAGAHFVVRFKEGVGYRILERFAVPQAPATAGFRLTSDWTIRLPGWEGVVLRLVSYRLPDGKLIRVLTDRFDLSALSVAQLYKERWTIAVSSEGHILQSVEVRPRLKDSSLVAWEAPWRESKTAEPSDNVLEIEYWQSTRLQRAVNVEVASLHAIPVAETVYNVRRQQGLGEMSPTRQPSPAGYQRGHGTKEDGSTGEARGARRGKLVEEMSPITVSGKWRRRRPGGGSGRSTVDRRATKRARREGPGPVSTPLVKVRQG
jgi:DDE family transposase